MKRGNQSLGIVLLTRESREVDQRLFEIRASVLGIFGIALGLTVALSFYLAQTLASPIMQLAGSAARMRQGEGRAGSVPGALLERGDEIGILARDLQSSATALWTRIDTNERFAADVAHELRNPLTSVRSAIETLRRIDNPDQQRRLLGIIAEDAVRMDRLIADISDSSRVDAELSRTVAVPVDVAPILSTLAELHNATREGERAPELVLEAPAEGLVVRGVEGRLVQVFRNLLGNAVSFSPEGGRVWVRGAPCRGDDRGHGGGRGPWHPRGQAGEHLRALLLRASEWRALRAAFGAGTLDQQADRRGPSRPDRRGEPARRRWQGDRGALRRAAARGIALGSTPVVDPTLNRLIETACRQNPAPPAAGAHAMVARATRGVAIGAFCRQQQPRRDAGRVRPHQARHPRQRP